MAGDDMKNDLKPVGLTKNGGYEFGLRKTFPIGNSVAWNFLMSPDGIRLWLGESVDFKMEKGAAFHTMAGDAGIVTTINPEKSIRLTWQTAEWLKPSIIQMRVIPADGKTMVSFHHENLPDASSREQMRLHWQVVMKNLANALPMG
jgi:uncharacterized protein YndB with AHSA1/START domain